MANKSIDFAGGNNVTLSTATAASITSITISGPNTHAQQTAISGLVASDATYTSGTVVVIGGNNVTVQSGANQSVIISGPNTHAQQTAISAIYDGAASISSGTIRFTNANNVTFTINGQTLSGSVHAQQTGISSIVGSDATYTSGSVQFTGSNMVTVKSSANQRIVIDATQTVQTAGIPNLGVSTGGNTSGDTGVASGTRLVLAGGNNVTLSQGTAANATTITISVPNTSSQTDQSAIKGFGASNTGNTAGNTGISTGIDWVIAGTNNVTVSESTAGGGPNTIWLSAAGGGAGQFSGGASNLGNTAGSTGVTGTRYVFAGTNAVSLSQSTDANGGTLSINVTHTTHGHTNFSGGVSNVGNTAGSTGVTGTRLVIAATNHITLSQSTDANGGTVTIVPGPLLNQWNNMPRGIATANNAIGWGLAPGIRTWRVFPMNWGQAFPGVLTAKTMHMQWSQSGSTATMSQAHTTSWSIGVWTLNGSTLSLLNSASTSFGYAGAATNNSTGLVSARVLSIHSSLWSSEPVFTPGRYWLGVAFSTAGVSFQTLSWLAMGDANATSLYAQNIGTMGVATVATNDTRGHLVPFDVGNYSATSGAPPTSITQGELIGTGNAQSRAVPLINLLADGPQSY